ncbi:MAG TPA: peptidyl-prolyl cis-trans isomerase [Polyangiaceae bacterium]|nr:peptidyl-prolyl cis-trans isomerase [Polyangiaceae bacterium]
MADCLIGVSERAKLVGFLAGCCLLVSAPGCRKKQAEEQAQPAASADPSADPKALTDEQAKQVLARVGDRSITLGEYAAALERMDPFERLRYQSADRRRLLLNEMVEIELLAQEARRRGLDRQPETQERLRQMLRDELLKEARRRAKSESEPGEAEIRKYYDEHKADFNEPERRRVAHLVLASQAQAQALLQKAKGATAAEWGKLVSAHSLEKLAKGFGSAPPELAGDIGIVGPPGHPRGANPRVPEALREAVFRIEKVGDVWPEVVADAGKFHVVRLTAKTEARERSFQEAERTIRVALVQERVKRSEAALEQELRSKFPVTIDQAALANVKVPELPKAGAKAPLPR